MGISGCLTAVVSFGDENVKSGQNHPFGGRKVTTVLAIAAGMGSQELAALVAIFLGLAVSALLFVPFVWFSYRRRGGMSLTRTLFFIAALVYFWAIWTFTLLPLPEPSEIQCAPVELNPMSVVTEIQKGLESANPLTSPAILQLVFNVLLFVPLGIIVRVVWNKGIVVALLVGLGISLFVELTQYTGVWGIYPCAYRIADVGDLMTNTTGAIVGSLLGLVVPRERRGIEKQADAATPSRVTRGRRALAMLCDGLGFWFVAGFIGIAIDIARYALLPDETAPVDDQLSTFVGTGLAAAIWLGVIVVTGRSIGDLAVQLRYVSPRQQAIARPLRWLGGIGGISALGLVLPFAPLLVVPVAVILFFTTAHGRGLPGLLAGAHLADARETSVPVGPRIASAHE